MVIDIYNLTSRFKPTFSYKIYGSGPKILVAFHGFGQESSVWASIGEAIAEEYTLYAMDMPFHGISFPHFVDAKFIRDWYLEEVQDLIKDKFSNGPIGLLGYSLGARFCQMLYIAMPEQINRMVLIAPDGFKPNRIYSFAAHTMVGRSILRLSIHNYGMLYALIMAAKRYNLVQRSLIRFSESQMKTTEMRRLVYVVWTGLRYFRVALREFEKLVLEYKTDLSVIIGKFDRVVTRLQIEESLPVLSQSILKEIEYGHHQLLTKGKHEIVKTILNQ